MLHTETIPSASGSGKTLMLVLHGLGDTWRGWEWLPEALELPSITYRFANAPDSYYDGFSWYDFLGDQSFGIRRSRLLIHQLLDQSVAEGFDPGRIVVLGFSQGCVMTLDAGLRYPGRLAGLVGISGYIHEPEALLREWSLAGRTTKTLVTHGRLDTVVPIDPTRRQIAGLRSAGLPVEWEEYPKAHSVDFGLEIPRIRRFVQQILA